ncbi:SDR family oxidoreductase [Mycobacterium intracellulare]|uniref:SDR family oxidoreductase n=1 Tax=Mycobacterium intracellulare TaxID=1767 RepID=UPI000BAC13EA|nr:SDR family oxidoreductase [Mycobacterium intracellulare]ASW98577.1 short-chain dehydrogenase [Mycobacterium intracellulare subsp. chimaera]PBA61176.1 short-chain dehydrogenase [Mycobacterium intracellulare subsp. chimaera]PBA61404.1 short-chain dehydrogenase [Mycobacterium intracellulare subsp. chimaera]
MSLFDAFSYRGKRVLVVGGATGMGNATARLALDAGADVVVMDYADCDLPGATAVHVNLADKSSIGAALTECGGPVNALFACAGVADGPGIERINFIGHRYLIERLRAEDFLPRGSAIGFISSAAGLAWRSNMVQLNEFLDIMDFDTAAAWAVDNGCAHYMFTKQAVCAYVAREAMDMIADGIRINAICPGPTDTPLAQANAELWLDFGADYRAKVGVAAATPMEQAYPLLFLCSEAASVVNGITLVTDSGYLSAGITEAFPAGTPMAKMLLDG